MRTVLRLSLLLTGISLLIISIGSHILRREPSTAYWVLGEITDGDDRSLFLSSPNERVQRRIIEGSLSNEVENLAWLPDEMSFLYFWEREDEIQEVRRYSLKTGQSDVLGQHDYSIRGEFGTYFGPIPNRNELMITMNADQATIFALNEQGDIIRQLTPFHNSIRNRPIWSPDGEWLYYVGQDVDGSPDGFSRFLPPTLYRQRYDGSDRTELLRVPNATLGLWQATSENVFVEAVVNLGDISTVESQVFHLSTVDGVLTPITPEGERFHAFSYEGDSVLVTERNDFNTTGIYRVSANGEDFALLLDDDQEESIVPLINDREETLYGPIVALGSEEFLVAVTREDQKSLYGLNITTGEYEVLMDHTQFVGFYQHRFSLDKKTLIFTTQNYGGNELYRLDFRTGSLDVIELQAASTPNATDFTEIAIVTTTGNKLLVTEAIPIGRDYQLEFYLLDFETGDYKHIFSETSANQYARTYVPPSDPHEIIVSMEEYVPSTRTTQFRVDIQTGEVEGVSFGRNLKFSPIVDNDWQMHPTLIGGLALMILALIWSTAKFWHYGSHYAITITT